MQGIRIQDIDYSRAAFCRFCSSRLAEVQVDSGPYRMSVCRPCGAKIRSAGGVYRDGIGRVRAAVVRDGIQAEEVVLGKVR